MNKKGSVIVYTSGRKSGKSFLTEEALKKAIESNQKITVVTQNKEKIGIVENLELIKNRMNDEFELHSDIALWKDSEWLKPTSVSMEIKVNDEDWRSSIRQIKDFSITSIGIK